MMALRILPGGMHNDFEDRVVAELRGQGFFVEALTYHDGPSEVFVNALRGRRSPTALAIRTRADRVCLSSRSPLAFSLEAKTILTDSPNWAVEAFPLGLHLLDATLGIEILYVYRTHQGRECGFWCSRPPRFSAILIPANATVDVRQFRDLPAFAGAPMRKIGPTRGSGDPFALINAQDVDALSDWRELVAQAETEAQVVTA